MPSLHLRALCCAILLFTLTAPAARAGDFATFSPFGFSADGSVFAFEEFGVEDGSGFPYSNVFFIDTERDTFLNGTPFRARIHDETAELSAVRGQTVHQALSLIEQNALLDHPGTLAAFNPPGEVVADAGRLSYRPHPNLERQVTLSLETLPLPPRPSCVAVASDAKGFRLTFTGDDGVARIIQNDDRIPESRGCPTDYRLGGVMTYPVAGDVLHVALIMVLSAGFEGPNGRWIAIPFREEA